ncbi:baseplate J/gp47 family protein [Psychrobacillus sp. FSL K6-2684]|uniref:baseplate assembly protein n=1 Tax=Psychrobacillus sp. FSL K6-2684 TaxID=2921547 RepID=UPI0030F56A0C
MSLNDLPDISFVETNPEQILADIIMEYENAYFASTGTKKSLAAGDPIRIFLYTQALREIQLKHLINDTAKQNTVKYARGGSLEHLGSFTRTPRLEEKSAVTRMKLSFSKNDMTNRIIPSFTRFSTPSNVVFRTKRDYVLPAGKEELIISVECEEAGEIGNGFLPGTIRIIVDPLPFMVDAVNIDETQGGVEAEDDEKYRERVYLAPEKLSLAGPEGAYIYHALSYNPLISDIKVLSPKGTGIVNIYVILNGGILPSEEFLVEFEKYFSKDIRPLTDYVQAHSPTVVEYDAQVTYYISTSEREVTEVHNQIEEAFQQFLYWQKTKIGRDINPSELVHKLRMAGAKRVEVTLPTHTIIADTEIAKDRLVNLVFGGMEND